MKNTLLLGFLLFLVGYNTAFAVKVNSLYMDEVAVTSQSPSDRQKAIQTALANVFIKVSGNEKILTNPFVKQQLRHASSLVQQFGYSTSSLPNKETPYLLQVHFDMDGVNQCLRDAKAPVWENNRPLILAWINDETSGTAEILSNTQTSALKTLLNQTMEKRGLPYVLPAMDDTDAHLVNAKLISDMDISKLLVAAKRYKNDGMLIGSIHKTGDIFTTQWKLVMGPDQWEWNITGKTPNDVVSMLVYNITNTLSSKLAIVTTNTIQTKIDLKIQGIQKQSDFTDLVRYLNHLAPVASVGIVAINGTDVTLNISLRSNQESFLQAIASEQKLSALDKEAKSSPMIFQWNPQP